METLVLGEEALKQFCSNRHDPRTVMQAPYVRDGWLCATDGRVGVMVQTEAPDSDPKGPNLPALVLEFHAKATGEWKPWPKPEAGKTRPCESCYGKGTAIEKCSVCRGTGEVECPRCGNDTECENCHGNGNVHLTTPCPQCTGTGLQPDFKQEVGGYKISGRHAEIIAGLPNVEFSVITGPESYQKITPFRFEGGLGVVKASDEGA